MGEILRDSGISRGWERAGSGDARFLNIETKRIRRRDGSFKTFERLRHGGVAVIVPVAADGKLILLRQYRPAVGAWLYELPAGLIERGERPRECAVRELEEETGFTASEVKELFSSYSSPGWSTERHYFFLARGLGRGKQRLDEDERLTVKALAADELQRMIRDGRIIDGKTIQGIFYYLQEIVER
jgi:ADP-ribose pyrophosphatase